MKRHKILLLFSITLVFGMIINELRHYYTNRGEMKLVQPKLAVTTMKLKEKEVHVSEELLGRAVPYQIAEIRPQVSGIIIKNFFIEGSNVEKGQQLYQIDPAPYHATCQSAKASLTKALAAAKSIRAQTIRYKELIQIQAISKQDYDNIIADLAQAEAEVEMAKADLNIAQINLEYTKVYAPISGRISKSNVTVGALVTANQAGVLTTITQLDPVYIDVMQSSEDNYHFQQSIKSQKLHSVELMLPAKVGPYSHYGILKFSDILVDTSTGSVQVRFLFPNPESEILPGMFVRAKMNMISDYNILVPQQATMRNADGNLSVWKVKGGNKGKLVNIKADKAIGNQWLISEGLQAGDIIITEGMQKMTPNVIIEDLSKGAKNESEILNNQES